MQTLTPATQRSAFFSLIFLLGLSLFAFAIGMKWMKWTGGSAMMIISAVLAMVGAFTSAARGWMGITLCALVLGITAVVLWWRGDRVRKGALAAMLVVLAGGAAFMSTPVHAVYGYMMLETPGAKRFIHSGVGQWYKYSWLLYQDGQYEKSTVMIDSAMAIVSDHHARTGSSGEWLLVKLDSTRDRIAARNWNEFHELAK